MYYGLHEHKQIETVQDALQQRADSSAGDALINILSPNISVSQDPDSASGLYYSVEVALRGYWGNGEGESLQEAFDAAMWDVIGYLNSVTTQRFLNKNASRYLQELHGNSWEPRGSR